jgi:5-methylcytosine-specific restriction protein B
MELLSAQLSDDDILAILDNEFPSGELKSSNKQALYGTKRDVSILNSQQLPQKSNVPKVGFGDKSSILESAIEAYKNFIKETGLKGEIYKWKAIKHFQDTWNPNADNFGEMFELAIKQQFNLMSYWSSNMLRYFCRDYPMEFKEAILMLYDESIELQVRINRFQTLAKELSKRVGSDFNDFQDERAISVYLTFRFPDRYVHYKNSFYSHYCKLMDIKKAKTGEKFIHFQTLAQEFKEKYISPDPDLADLIRSFLGPDDYTDSNLNLLTQDFFFFLETGSRSGSDINYWIIGAGEKARFWAQFQSQGIAAIGEPPIGDLNQYETKEEIEAAIQSYEKTDKRRYNDALAGYEICQVMKPGDIIFVKRGNSEFLGYGEVTSGYFFDESLDYQHYRNVLWKKTGVWKEDMGKIVQKTLTNITDYPSEHPDYDKYYQRILALINGTYTSLPNKPRAMTTRFPLNQIFYGPPGTGKTYNTISEAIKIIDPEFFAENNHNRQEMQNKFNDLLITDWERIDGRKIAFCTFHQSMSYEDFIEGIKPKEPEKEGDPVVYSIEEGLFHKLSTEATFSIALKKESADQAQILDFSLAYDQFAQELEEKLSSDEVVELDTRNGGKVLVDSVSRLGNFIIKHHGGTRIYTVSKNRISKLAKAIDDLDDVSNINELFREIIGGSNSSAYWAVLNGIRQKKYHGIKPEQDRKYSWDEKKELIHTLTNQDYKDLDGEPYVLIIDEINRGNVSQIFGELITLIEDNKRLGNPDALQTVLPYSKTNYGIPPNLYIIGTMNTADRSVEALDTALRRRFTFREFMPDPELIKEILGPIASWKGIHLSEVLTSINKRIEILLDRDHQIGHSDFLALKQSLDIDSDLKRIFTKKIIPLLQEYFYNDYVKVGMVLGEGFVSAQKRDTVKFAHIEESLDADYADGYLYRLISEDQIDMENALNQLMN